MNKYDKKFMEIANSLTELTDDPNRGVACLIVKDNNIISHGVNVLSNGVTKTEERVTKPLKSMWISHSERNAIFKAAKEGYSTDGCKMYVTYFPCHECARAIIQAGIKEIITYEPDFSHEKWGESWNIALDMFEECGVKITFYNE